MQTNHLSLYPNSFIKIHQDHTAFSEIKQYLFKLLSLNILILQKFNPFSSRLSLT